MFEDSLIESSGQMKTKKGATVFISAIVHVTLIVVLDFDPIDLYGHDRGPSARRRSWWLRRRPRHRRRRHRKMWLRHLWSSSKFRSIRARSSQPTEIPKEIARIVEERPAE